MNKTQFDRFNRLLPEVNGEQTPKNIRCYDNGGKTADRYTIVFIGNYPERKGCDYIGCNEHPNHPAIGIYQHGWNETIIDKPTYSHLGKKIKFKDLPNIVQIKIMDDYAYIWKLDTTKIHMFQQEMTL